MYQVPNSCDLSIFFLKILRLVPENAARRQENPRVEIHIMYFSMLDSFLFLDDAWPGTKAISAKKKSLIKHFIIVIL